MNDCCKTVKQRSDAALARGNWLQAVDLLQRSLDNCPDCYDTAVRLARIYMEYGHFRSAEEAVDQAFTASTTDPFNVCPLSEAHRDLFLLKANLCLARGNAYKAVTLYMVLLADRPDDPDLLLHVALGYEKTGQREMALAYLNRVLAVDPDHLPSQEIKAQLLLGLGRLHEALDLYTEITLSRPDSVNAYAMMGRIYDHLGRQPAAQLAWQRAVALAPNADEPLRLLGRLAVGREEWSEARDLLTRAVAANPKNALAHLDLADLLERLGETRAALAHWDEAFALAPQQVRIAEAVDHWQQVAQAVSDGFAPLPDRGGDEAEDGPTSATAQGPAGS